MKYTKDLQKYGFTGSSIRNLGNKAHNSSKPMVEGNSSWTINKYVPLGLRKHNISFNFHELLRQLIT